MDASTYLRKLIQIKSKPGKPLITKDAFETIEHIQIIDNHQAIMVIACLKNEPEVLSFMLDRYVFDPNRISAVDQLSLSVYTTCCMFHNIETIRCLLERKIYPDNWYYLLFALMMYKDTKTLTYLSEQKIKMGLGPGSRESLFKRFPEQSSDFFN